MELATSNFFGRDWCASANKFRATRLFCSGCASYPGDFILYFVGSRTVCLMETKYSIIPGYTLLLQGNLNSYTLELDQFSPTLLPSSFKAMQMSKDEPLTLKLAETKLSFKTSPNEVLSIKKCSFLEGPLACL